ncbi:hypothetical protein DLH72_01885 [Candidatus Gracilibacteria bacterium]|nr:MAG: hypothetical protein DLH72_01885 [Candidatus Gracilibacteria bacterium]
MKIIKFLFSKTILINYLIQIILPLILTIIFTFGEYPKNLDIEDMIFGYNSANSFGIWFLNMLKSGFERNIYIDIIYIFIFKYIFVLVYVKIIGENNKKTLITISIISSVLGTLIGYIIFGIFSSI